MANAPISNPISAAPRTRRISDLSKCLSPTGWALLAVCGLLQYVILLQPSLKEIIVFLVIDTLAYMVVQRVEGKIFDRLYPGANIYFRGINELAFKKLSNAEKINLFESFLKLPLRRAVFTSIGSYIKILPAAAVAVFYWEHDTSNIVQFLIFMGCAAVTLTYFYGGVFIEAHFFVSDLIKEIHERFNWSDVFKTINFETVRADFEIQEWTALVTLTLFMLIIQTTLILSSTASDLTLALQVILVGVVAMVLLGHLFYLSRKFLLGGLKDLFGIMDTLDYKSTDVVIPLHSTELLARFEKSFNLLIDRLRKSEQEIASWIFTEAEKTRYRTLGEMSALVAHDMTSPIHVVNFCVEQIKETPSKANDPKYMGHLSENLKRVLDLIESLRARLKDSGSDKNSTSVTDAHEHVIRLLETQYSSKNFDRIKFSVDEALQKLKLPLSRVDLIHILDNIYRNSVENMLQAKSVSDCIQIRLAAIDDKLRLWISDTGSGLSADNFEKLTAFEFLQTKSRSGLGLKLTRRLVEMNGGSLDVLEIPQEGFSTTFALSLPYERETQPQGV